MIAYDMPSSLTIGGRDYSIRYQWRPIIDILIAMNDPDLSEDWQKVQVMLEILYPDLRLIPDEYMEEAIHKACEFIDCGHKDDGKPKPKMIDWEKDASVIVPEINQVANMEVRLNPNIHWWTFFGWFMKIGDGLLGLILHIRQKKAKGEKLEKWEQEFYKANKDLIDMKAPETEEIRAEKDSILKWL